MSSAQTVSSRSESSASEYQYNYTYVAPLAMAQGVPANQRPTLEWWGQVITQVLHIASNRLHWVQEQEQRKHGGAAPALSLHVDLSHVGVGALDLGHLQALPAPSTLAGKLFGELHEFGEAAELAGKAALLARKAFNQELGSVFDVLKLVLEAITTKPTGRPGSMQDYFNLFTTLPLPAAASSYEEDTTFAWMRVAGFNPLVLRRAHTLEDTLGLQDAALGAVLGEGDTVQRALDEGRLYLADYKALARVVNGNAPVSPKYCFAPRALFGLPAGSGLRQLRPLGIRCGQDASTYALFTPADGEAWLQAKTTVNVADVNYHEMISHLGHTHLLVEPFVVATHRNLPDDHPVSLLLRPHFEGTLYINNAAQAKLIAPGGDVDMLMAGTIQASRTVSVESLLDTQDFDFNQGMLPNALKQRDVNDPDLDYPYREDARLVWGAIENWVRAYVGLYYTSDTAVAQDTALQAWSAEVVAQEGGRVKGFGEDGVAGKLTTVDYLIQALTMLIFTGSAQHAAVNFAQAGVMTFVPLAPAAAYRAAPPNRADAALNPGLDQYPPLDMAAEQLSFLSLLGGVHHTKLGDYPFLWFKNLHVHGHLKNFQADLERIGATIQERNTTRRFPYPYFIPSAIPQSINI
ncbi:lipoxygenase family protein [Archangium primigenium]|uniref:lipoxygenase family protein n=1 Tax=[Archangium] primigenium TaxID=2792470 RepID=UPI00195D111C|nr:lipoxygenase family protein [Archangium primigenium]MBM7113481.1 lipoxygenase [Archangium primigenium]